MADVNKTIKSSGGDYATITLFEAAIPADQAVGNPWIGSVEEAYNADSADVIFNVSNANSAPHRVTVGVDYRTYNQAGWPVIPTAMGQAARMSGKLSVRTDDIIIEFLANTKTTQPGFDLHSSSNNSTVRYCPMKNLLSRAASGGLWHNCIVTNTARSEIIGGGVNDFYQMTFLANVATDGLQDFGGAMQLFGNIYFNEGAGDGISGGGLPDDAWGVSDDPTYPTNSLLSQTATDWLEDPAVATADARIKSAKQGVQLTDGSASWASTIGTLDFLQVDRDDTGSWDVGAIGVVTAAADVRVLAGTRALSGTRKLSGTRALSGSRSLVE